ncbi:MAG: HAMP domain-containing histidine kinase [Clostridia bacterium]|nr:HAMP domain-containing histidine kinase [Clostridia bacterium]
MGKPYRFRYLISLFVFLVIFSSSLLTVIFYSFLRGFRLLPHAFLATVWMPIVLIVVINIISNAINFLLIPRTIRPIEMLISATDQVAKGDFSVRIDSRHLNGEMKELVESFNAMTEELGNTEIFRSDFIRDFSHEFKTPIVSMKGFAKQLKNPDLTEEERRQYCDIIIAESERLSHMSSNILLLSKYENQQIIGDKKLFSLDEQIRDSILLFEKAWEKKELELELELDSIQIEQNAEMLCHVWNNLISNAVKFTPEKGKITVRAAENESSVAVTVSDTGIGMTEAQQKRVFDKCYQADPSHAGEGNGLGLSIVKRIVTLCGGSVSVHSAPQKGSTFTVLLPKNPSAH